ncbi:MAG: Crp/Fnr family transcriptional regulator [Nitrospira sp.]|nr:Crp/Fnr family transcriptional regulator [Nitrospira sp.]
MSPHDPSASHFCAQLSEGDWRRHCPSLTVVRLSDKRVIHHQGDACDDVFVVMKGRVKLLRLNRNGDQFVIAVLTEGQWFGAALSDRSPVIVTDTAEAKGRTVLYKVPLKEMRELLTRDGDVAWHALEAQTIEIHALRRKLELMRFHDVRSRLTETLRDLARTHGGHCRHGFELDIKLTQQELADLVGASRPVVSTLLNDLKSRGVLDYHRTLICIQNLAALE